MDAGENEKKSIYIEALNLDSKKWITKDNLQETIREQLIVPHNLDFTEYYQRLREQSYHADAGLIGSNYDYFNNRAETKDRNKLVHPFYVEIKSCIKHLTYSPEIQLQEEYEGLKSRLYNYPDKIQLIRQKYLKIFKASRALDSKPDVYLARAHKQLGLLLKLLGYWDKYITLVKMDDTQISSYAASLDGSNRELEDKFLEEDEGWDNDMKDPNPETSDYFDMEKTTAEEFLENLKSKEAPVEVKFNKFEETDNLGTDADMYGDSFGKSVEPAAVESKATLDQLLDELNRDFSVSDLFDKSQDIPDAKTFKKDESGEVYPEIPRSFNPAISLTSLQEKLSKINEVDLDMQARWKRSECLSMIESLNNLRIQEPHMLLKIFDHNQYDPPTFE